MSDIVREQQSQQAEAQAIVGHTAPVWSVRTLLAVTLLLGFQSGAALAAIQCHRMRLPRAALEKRARVYAVNGVLYVVAMALAAAYGPGASEGLYGIFLIVHLFLAGYLVHEVTEDLATYATAGGALERAPWWTGALTGVAVALAAAVVIGLLALVLGA